MDKTPDTGRRSIKRPHSPQEDKSVPNEPKASTDSGDRVLDSESKRDKLMRLLGGKKRKNETAASKWLERVRSREDDLKVSTELESQFNESLTNKLTGQSRRHVGIGFHDDARMPSGANPAENATSTSPNNNSKHFAPELGTKKDARESALSTNIISKDTNPSILDSLSSRANVPGIHKSMNFNPSSRDFQTGLRFPQSDSGYIRAHGVARSLPPPIPNFVRPHMDRSYLPPPTVSEFIRPHGGPGYGPPSFSHRFVPPQYGSNYSTHPPPPGFARPNMKVGPPPPPGFVRPNLRTGLPGFERPNEGVGHMAPSKGMGFVKSSESIDKTQVVKDSNASNEKAPPKTKNAFYAQFKKAS